MATHAGNTSEEFARIVRDWAKTARHPTFRRPYTELTYQPMRELLDYLRANGFKTYIVSGGGVEFLRVFAEELYGVPPEQVIGSSIKTKYEVRDGRPVIVRLPEIDFIDDKAGKPVGIHKFIGRRPIAAFGNSDGDFEMLEWTTAAPGPRLGVIVHHDDAGREFAYDRDESFRQARPRARRSAHARLARRQHRRTTGGRSTRRRDDRPAGFPRRMARPRGLTSLEHGGRHVA